MSPAKVIPGFAAVPVIERNCPLIATEPLAIKSPVPPTAKEIQFEPLWYFSEFEAAESIAISPTTGEPGSALGATFIKPFTDNKRPGEVVPIPTLPAGIMTDEIV